MKGSRVQISDSALKIKRLHFDATSFFLPDSFDESEKAETSAVVPFRQADHQDTAIRKTRHFGAVADNFPAFHSNRKSVRQEDHTQHRSASDGSNTLEYKRFRHLEIRCRISRINLPTGQFQPGHRMKNPHPEDQPRKHWDSAPTRESRPDPADWLQPARSSKRCSAGRVSRCPGEPNSSE